MVRTSLKYHKRTGNKIISNVQYNGLTSRQYEPLVNAGMIFELAEKKTPCYLGLDELASLASSRKGLSVLNDIFTTFALLSRKYEWQLEYSEQYCTMVDLRIRAITDDVVEPTVCGRYIEERHYIPHPYEYYYGCQWEAASIFPFYDHEAPPLTLNIKELQYAWNRYQREHNLA